MREIYMCSKHIEETYKKKPEPIKKEAKINNDFDEKKYFILQQVRQNIILLSNVVALTFSKTSIVYNGKVHW